MKKLFEYFKERKARKNARKETIEAYSETLVEIRQALKLELGENVVDAVKNLVRENERLRLQAIKGYGKYHA